MGFGLSEFRCSRPALILAILAGLSSCTRGQRAAGPLAVVETGSGAEVKLQPGDVLVGWNRGGASGRLTNSFDLYRAEHEESARGAVTILGRRGDQEQKWVMGPAPWRIAAVPGADGELVRVHREAARLMKEGKAGQAAGMWEQESRRFSDSAKVWLQVQAAKARASAGSWKQSDGDFEAARKNPAAAGGTLLHLNREWAESFRQRGEWEPAKDRYEKALRIATELNAELIQAGILYDLGAMFNERRRPRESLPYLEKALAIRERIAPDTREMATFLNGLGQSLYYQVQVEKAEGVFRRALAIGERLAPNGLGVAATLQNLGLIAMDRDRPEEAESHFKRSMEIAAREEPEGILWSVAADSLGTLYRRAGDLDRAEPFQKHSLEIRRRLRPDSLLVAACLNNLANLHRSRGDLAQAEAEFRESLAINQKLAPGTREVAGGLHNLGTLAHSRKEWKLAGTYYREAAELWEKLAPGSVYWAGTLVNLSQVLTEEGNFSLAEQTYRKALSVPDWQRRSPLSAARAGSALAEIFSRTGRLNEAAGEYAKSVSAMQEKMPGSLDLAEILSAQADLAQRRNQWAEAEALQRKALAIRTQLAPSTAELAESLFGMAEIAQHARRNAEAEKLYVRAVEALEAQTARVGGSEMTGPQFRAGYLVLYEKLVEFLVDQKRYAEAFRWLERSRGRILLDHLARRDLNFAGVDSKLMAEIRDNAAEYSESQSAIAGLTAGKDGNAIGKLQSRLLQLNAERAHLFERVRQTAPRVSSLRQPVPLTYEQARGALDPGTTLVSFLVAEQRMFVFLVQSSAAAPISVVSVPVGKKDLQDRVNEFRNAVKQPDFGKLPAAMRQARGLYDLLLQPVERVLESSKRLLIIPDGPLHGVPFAALRRANNAYLVEWKPIHTTISATLYSELKRARKPPESIPLALAAFGGADYAVPASSSSVSRSLPPAGSLTPLPYSRVEIEQIAALYAGNAQLNVGVEATEERARQSRARILHFALHGLLDTQNPLNSALVFSLPKKAGAGQEDGYLQAWEIYESVHWASELVVLSACESGVGQAIEGEGLMSLTRAIHFAGARAVLSTLWSVDDRKTTQLMTAFYKNLRLGKSKDEALRAAQTEMISSQSGTMPFYWAGFALNGDWQ